MTVTVANLRTVLRITSTSVVSDNDLTFFIDQAGLVIAEDLAGITLSSGRSDMIQVYLAAHLATLAIDKGGLVHQKVGDSEERYQPISEKALGLNTTKFGQTAISLDSSGTLSKLAGPSKKALFEVI